ncbi:MAG TPA: hypothetical protein VM618_11745 [Acidimicrobiia bacterium]|nr:hypothetical protein [Acidimicrobiia bacterium]
MEAQLRLITGESRGRARSGRAKSTASRRRREAKRAEWRARWALDAETKRRGLDGVARARQALEASRPPEGHQRQAS